MLYQGCTIIVLSSLRAPLDFQTFRKRAGKRVKTVEEFGGRSISVFEEGVEDDIWTTYVAFPSPNVVVIATDHDYLHTVLTQMRRGPNTRAVPPELPEWKYVNTGAAVWGIRHYRNENAESDPTSASIRILSTIGAGPMQVKFRVEARRCNLSHELLAH